MQDKKILSSFLQRSDIAKECVELLMNDREFDRDGIRSTKEEILGLQCETVEIISDSGAEKLHKPKGKYITVDIGKIWSFTTDNLERTADVCAQKLSSLLPEGNSCLLVCLGNSKLTADSQGPACADNFIVTSHIKRNDPKLFSQLSLFDTSCIIPGVLGKTGMEAATTVKGIVEKHSPDFVIAVDSLAARRLSRVASTLQMSNTGISPGSGIGNRRVSLDKNSLGIPVISLGIPTVADAVTVGADILEEYFLSENKPQIPRELQAQIIDSVLNNGSEGCFVTLKNADEISAAAAKLIGMTVNKALNPELSFRDMSDLAN